MGVLVYENEDLGFQYILRTFAAYFILRVVSFHFLVIYSQTFHDLVIFLSQLVVDPMGMKAVNVFRFQELLKMGDMSRAEGPFVR